MQVGIAGGRLHPGNQAEKVRDQDEHKDAAEERYEAARAVKFGNIGDETVEPFGDNFADAAQGDALVGSHRIARRR